MADTIPSYPDDIFGDDAIVEPYEHYRRLRELGPVVHLPAQQTYAVGRYADVRAALAAPESLCSGQGVGLNDVANELIRGTTLASDDPLHAHLRRIVAHRLTPRAMRTQRDHIEKVAQDLVTGLLERSAVDGVTDIAQAMPMAIVPDFLGFPLRNRDRLLPWASAGIEALGPVSARTPRAAALAGEMNRFATELVTTRDLAPTGLGADVLAAADLGEVSEPQCAALLQDYLGPSLETTVSAIGHALVLFADHPDQWTLLRGDPSLIGGAVNEVVRLESPLRGFSRVTTGTTDIGGAVLAPGERVLLLFASANRDERKWTRPDVFDITRPNADHLGFGYGVHGCAGQGLARLEISAVVGALARHVAHIEPAGTPVRQINSMLNAYASLPLRLHAA